MPVFHDWVAAEVQDLCADISDLLDAYEGETALDLCEEALESLSSWGSNQSEGVVMCLKALCLARLDEDEEALETAQEARKLFLVTTDPRGSVEALSTLVEVHRLAQRLDDASQLAQDLMKEVQTNASHNSQAAAWYLQAEVFFDRGESLEAAEAAAQAYKLAGEVSDELIMGKVACLRGRISEETEAFKEVLAEAAIAHRHFQTLEHMAGKADSMVLEAAARLGICEDRSEGMPECGWLQIIKSAQAALNAVKAFKPQDHAAVGSASRVFAKACLHAKAVSEARNAARQGLISFQKARDVAARTECLLLLSRAELASGNVGHMRAWDAASQAVRIFQELRDKESEEEANQLLYEIDDAMRQAHGMPSRAEEAEQLAAAQQAFMLQQQAAPGGTAQALPSMSLPALPAPPGGTLATTEKKPSGAATGDVEAALSLSGGSLDAAVLRPQILKLAVAIIGDDEDIETDTPLMEAGLTSNSAVLMRDTLRKELEGVNLPPTLIFDYPSVAAIAEFIASRT
mmetsp:Transcript_35149/g.79290  ORF Transcript_35149/g.79290 Transcript_35149/m.79290 type:complete len:517 (+) Transcript_35149:67-1617(+)